MAQVPWSERSISPYSKRSWYASAEVPSGCGADGPPWLCSCMLASSVHASALSTGARFIARLPCEQNSTAARVTHVRDFLTPDTKAALSAGKNPDPLTANGPGAQRQPKET